MLEKMDSLERIRDEIIDCRKCPRLVVWRESVAVEKRASFAHEEYWGRPVPGFGDPSASLVIVELAPAAHGGNRTGRVFTGDRSGGWFFRALHKAGFANQPSSRSGADGLQLYDAYVSAVVRCAPPSNKPSVAKRNTCIPYLERELAELGAARVIIALGRFAQAAIARMAGIRPRPRFRHGVEGPLPDGRTLICSYHPSQQNT